MLHVYMNDHIFCTHPQLAPTLSSKRVQIVAQVRAAMRAMMTEFQLSDLVHAKQCVKTIPYPEAQCFTSTLVSQAIAPCTSVHKCSNILVLLSIGKPV